MNEGELAAYNNARKYSQYKQNISSTPSTLLARTSSNFNRKSVEMQPQAAIAVPGNSIYM